jgi:hypothetical protein
MAKPYCPQPSTNRPKTLASKHKISMLQPETASVGPGMHLLQGLGPQYQEKQL